MMGQPVLPPFAILPKGWGARIDYTLWSDPYVPKREFVAHYGGGANTAGSVSGVVVPGWRERPRPWRHPVNWWRWYDSPDFLAQLADERAVLKGWEAFHTRPVSEGGRGWRGIAYSFAVGQSGTVYSLRGWNRNAGHYESDDWDHDGIPSNAESLAVVFVLGHGQPPTRAAWRAFKKLRRWAIRVQPAVDDMVVLGHFEVAASGGHSTACPGGLVMERIIRRWR